MALRADVEALAALDRRSASTGERDSAEWVAGRLRQAGAIDVRIEPFRYQHTFGHSQALHFAGAALGRGAAALALLGFELEFSGRAQPLRRLLPAGEGANVIARVPAARAARRTVVLVAHHDAAHTGLMWSPAFAGGAQKDGRPPFSLLPELAMLAMAAGPRKLRGPARAVLALAAALTLEVTRGATVPGASDNATGVAAVIELVRRFAAEPLADTAIVAVIPGCEESGMGGMAAWMRSEGRRLRAETSFVLGLDTLGAGEPMVVSSEGPLWRVRYREDDLERVDLAAVAAGLPKPRRFRIGGWTDPALAVLAGIPAVSILSLAGNGFSNYHLPTDTPANVDWDSAERCLALAEAVLKASGR